MYLFQLFGDARDHKTRCTEGCILQERLDLCFILQSALIILASGAQNPDVTFIDSTFLTSFNQGILTKQEISYRTAAKNYHQFHTFKTKQSVEVKIFFSASFQSYLYIQPPYKKYFKSCFTGITRGQRRYVHKKSFFAKMLILQLQCTTSLKGKNEQHLYEALNLWFSHFLWRVCL